MSNGNKFKGNNTKKSFRKKNPYSDFDEKTDEYAKILSLQGGKHLTAQLLDNAKDKIVNALIKGSHHRKIWYKKDELIILRSFGNLYEVQGKVSEDEIKTIQRRFDMLEGNADNSFTFDDDLNLDGSDNSKQLRKINVNALNNKDESAFNFDDI